MLEVRLGLHSKTEWDARSASIATQFQAWRSEVIEAVRTCGLREPIGGAHWDPEQIVIDVGNLRESLSVGEMNSRKRAALLMLKLAHDACVRAGVRLPKILGTEALTRVGRILRGTWSHYLATEYLPNPQEQQTHFPIQHLDLADICLPDATFDLFHSGDVFEHLPDLPKALGEIARVLKPHGVAVSTFPFAASEQTTQRRARLVDGVVDYLAPPEYHGNPARPDEGSLVFSLPGWDVLEQCRQAGFADARMTFVMSTTYGIASSAGSATSAPSGVFVLTAQKAAASGLPRARAKQAADLAYQGPALSKIIGLLALPRSGTTLVSSMLGVHSQIKAVYEPWNANKTEAIPGGITISNFFQVFPTDLQGKPVVLVKETATHTQFTDNLACLLRSVVAPIDRQLIVLLRNPLHVFVSEIEARRLWWGEAELECTTDVFDRWADRSVAALRAFLKLAREFDTVLLSYEALVTQPRETLGALMSALRQPVEPCQLHFETHLARSEVRGDINIANDPQEISAQSMQRRARQAIELEPLGAGAQHWDQIRKIAEMMSAIEPDAVLQTGSPAAHRLIEGLSLAVRE